MKKKRISTETKKKIKIYAISVAAGFVAYIVSMVLFSLIISNADVPPLIISIMALISAGLFAFIASFLLCKITRSKGLITGAVIGIIVFGLISVVSLIFSSPGESSVSALNFVVTVVCGVLGGILGVNSGALKIK